jgi:hypothetical protein
MTMHVQPSALEVRTTPTRQAADAAVLTAIEALDRPQDAAAIARLAGVSLMAAAYSLRRLERAGATEREVEIIDTPGRFRTTVLMWRRASMPIEQPWPVWLAPCALPQPERAQRFTLC